MNPLFFFFEVIRLTAEQYWTVAWMMFNVGWFYSVIQMYSFLDRG